QGGHPPGPAAPDLRGQAAGGRPHPVGLQHPEGVHPAPGAPPARRTVDVKKLNNLCADCACLSGGERGPRPC
ncbi:unnamed protein product, partial [Hapterophycus canaliculatus]